MKLFKKTLVACVAAGTLAGSTVAASPAQARSPREDARVATIKFLEGRGISVPKNGTVQGFLRYSYEQAIKGTYDGKSGKQSQDVCGLDAFVQQTCRWQIIGALMLNSLKRAFKINVWV